MLRICAAVVAAGFTAMSANAETLSPSGIEGIVLDGASYDVTFATGTCADLFDGCDENGDFDFDEAGATAAVNAIAGVFEDPANSLYNSNPALTNGCTDSAFCQIVVPYATDATAETFSVRSFANRSPGLNALGSSLYGWMYNSEGQSTVFALFAAAESGIGDGDQDDGGANVVPLPASALLLLGGLGGLAITRRRRRA